MSDIMDQDEERKRLAISAKIRQKKIDQSLVEIASDEIPSAPKSTYTDYDAAAIEASKTPASTPAPEGSTDYDAAARQASEAYTKQRVELMDAFSFMTPVSDEQYRVISHNLAQIAEEGGDVSGTAFKWAAAIEYGRYFQRPAEDIMRDFDTYQMAWIGQPFTAKPTDLRAIKDSFVAGTLSVDMGKLAKQWKDSGGTDTELEKQLDTLSGQLNQLQDSFPRPWYTEALKAGARAAPYMIQVAGKGAVAAMAGTAVVAASGATAATLGGASPAVVAAAIGAARAAASFQESMQMMEGLAYYDMRKRGIRHDIAAPMAFVSGGVQAVIESSLGNIAKLVGPGGKIAPAAATNATSAIMKHLVASGKLGMLGTALASYGAEAVEEGTEELLQSLSDAIIQEGAASLEGDGVDRKTAQEIMVNAWQEFKGGFEASLLMGIPGTAIGYKGDAQQARTLSSFAGIVEKDDFIFKAKDLDLPMFEGLTPKDKSEALGKIWDAQKARSIKEPTEKTSYGDYKGEEAPAPTLDMTPEEAANFIKRANEPLPEGMRLQAREEIEGEQYILKMGDKEGKRSGFIRYSLEPNEGAQEGEAPGTVKIQGLEKGTAPNVAKALVRAISFRFPGWNIDWDTRTPGQEALRKLIVSENPRGEAAGLQHFEAPRDIPTRLSETYIRQRIKDVAPGWKEDEVDVSVKTIRAWGRMMGMSGDELADKVFDPRVFGKLITPTQASQGTTGAASMIGFGRQVRTLIDMSQKANPSTFMHEVTHAVTWFALANKDVDPKIAQFLQELEAAVGVENGDWNAEFKGWTENYKYQNRSNYEGLAYALEDYFRTGKAPRPGLEGLFQKMAEWVAAIMKGLTGARVNLSPELKAYFDKLIADPESPFSDAYRNETEATIQADQKESPKGGSQEEAELAQKAKAASDSESREKLRTLESARSRSTAEPQGEATGTEGVPIFQGEAWHERSGQWYRDSGVRPTASPIEESSEKAIQDTKDQIDAAHVAADKAYDAPKTKTLDQNNAKLFQGAAPVDSPQFRAWFYGSKIVDDNGEPLAMYSGHSNVEMYGEKYDPKRSEAGGFYATADPAIASSYAVGKMGGPGAFYENGAEYRFAGKNGKYNKKLWQIDITPELKAKIDEAAALRDEKYDEAVFSAMAEMKDYIENNKGYDAQVRRWSYQPYNLQNIYEFHEMYGDTVRHETKTKIGDMVVYRSPFEDLLDYLGLNWNSFLKEQPGVMKLYLSIRNPLDTSKPFPENLLAALEAKAKHEKSGTDEHWTKYLSMRYFVDLIKTDEGTHSWATQVPSKALPIIQSFGYDGILDTGGKMGGEKHQVAIAFYPEQVKSVFNRGTWDANESRMLYQGDGWVYRSEEIVNDKLQGPMPGKQILAMLRGAGGKEEELKWTGLAEYLATDEKRKPEEVRNYIAANKLQIEEVTKGANAAEEYKNKIIERLGEAFHWYDNATAEEKQRYNQLNEKPKFSSYTIPGGENYREVLFTLPVTQTEDAKTWVMYDKDGEIIGHPRGGETAEKAIEQFNRYYGEERGTAVRAEKETFKIDKPDYQSPHWEEPNVVAHTRLDDRTDTEGREMLFVEEIQSDWHQEGRKKGYKSELSDIESARFKELNALPDSVRTEEQKKELDDYFKRIGSKVPPAPFSKTWHEFVFKRIVREAAENGKDIIGWTTGEQQAERYDLSKQVKQLSLISNGKDSGAYNLVIEGIDGQELSDYSRSGKKVTPQELEDTVGKEVAKNLIAGADAKAGPTHQTSEWYDSKPEDLKIGGEGMKGFYDKMLVDYANKFGKKYGATVEDVIIPTGENTETVHALPVTEALRSAASQGLTLFQGEDSIRAQADGQPEPGAAALNELARDMAAEGKTWEEFAEYLETPFMEEERQKWGVPDLLEQQKLAWYKALWDDANSDPSKPDDVNAWIASLGENNHEKLKDLLRSIWTEVILASEEEPEPGATEEDVADWTNTRAKAQEYRDQIAEPVIAGALAIGAKRSTVSRQFLASVYGIIKANPEEYAHIAGEITGNAKLSKMGEQAAQEKYADIEDPRIRTRMGIAKRAALAEQIRDEKLAARIRAGQVVDKDIQDYVQKLKSREKQSKEELAAGEKEMAAMESQLDAKSKILATARKAELENRAEIQKLQRRMREYVENKEPVPRNMESQRERLEARRAKLTKALEEAGDWVVLEDKLKQTLKREAAAQARIDEAHARGESVERRDIETRSQSHAEAQSLKAKLAETKEYRDSAQLQTYLAKLESRIKIQDIVMQRDAEKKAITEIKESRERLKKAIMRKAGDKTYVKQQRVIKRIQAAINPESPRESTMKAINELRAELDKNPDLAREIPKVWLNRALKTNLNEMSLQELADVATKIAALKQTGRSEYERINNARMEFNEDAKFATAEIMMGLKGYKEPKGPNEETIVDRLHEKYREFDYAFKNMRRFARDMDGGIEGGINVKLLWDRVVQAYREERVEVARRRQAIMNGLKAHNANLEDWYNTKIEVMHAGPGRSTITLRKSELAGLEMAFRDEDSRAAALYGVFFSHREKRQMTEEEIMFEGVERFRALRAAIDETLTPEDLKVIDEVFSKDAAEAGPRLCETVAVVENREMASVENYFPISREGVTGKPIDVQLANDVKSRTPGNRMPPRNGMTKTRVKVSPKKQTAIKLDLMSLWMQSIENQEHYIANAQLGKTLDAVYQSPYVLEQIKGAFGSPGVDYVKEYIAEVKNPGSLRNVSRWENSIKYLRGNLGIAYLSFRASSALKQIITSPWPALPYAGPRLFVESMKMFANPVKYLRDTESMSIILQNRVQDQIMEAIKAAKADSAVGKMYLKIGQAGTLGLEYADRFSVAVGWRAVYEKALEEYDGNAEKATKKADDVILMTQPNSFGFNQSPIYRAGGEMGKLILQFTQALNVVYQNLRYDLPNQIKNHQYKTAIGTIIGYAMAGILLNAVTRGMSGDDDEDKSAKLAYWSISQFTESLPLIGEEAGNYVQYLFTGEREAVYGESLLPGTSRVFNGMYKLTAGDIEKGLEEFAIGSGMILGMPTQGYKEIKRTVTGDAGALVGRPKKKE